MGLKITVFGLWHLGSVTAAGLAELGYKVVGTGFNKKALDALASGRPPIFEPGLEELTRKHLKSKRLSFTFDKRAALSGADFIFVTFDTKVDEKDQVDLTDIKLAAAEISKYIKSGAIVVISSQVPVGTCTKMKEKISQHSGAKFGTCYVPENLRLGEALNSFLKPDRIVIGANDDATLQRVKDLFEPLKCDKITMSAESAEMSKHALNAYLATCISFISEISDLCVLSGASAMDVVRALKTDKRVSPNAPLKPGLGFSGGTLARDVQVLRSFGGTKNYETRLMDAVIKVNEERLHLVSRKLERVFGSINSLKVGILGLTYKPGTDTLRRSLSLEIAKDLIARGAIVKAFDPKVTVAINSLPKLKVYSSVEDVARGSEVLVLLTEWPEFKNLPLKKLKGLMKTPTFVDAKNFLDPAEFKKLKFKYIGVGYEA